MSATIGSVDIDSNRPEHTIEVPQQRAAVVTEWDSSTRMRPRPGHDSVLSCRGLRRSFDGQVVVDDVWFDVRAGEAYGLLGPDGAGKTTAVRMVCGLLDADSGSVLLQGRPIGGLDRRTARESVGYVAQSVVTLPSATVAETVRFWARFSGLPPGLRRERTAEVLASVGLEARGGDLVDRCSSGVLRELGLAVALLHRPRLLVLDEPVVGIDPRHREPLLATLGRLCDQGTAVLYASSNADEVARLCARVGVMDRGRLVEESHVDGLSVPVA